MKYQSDLEQLLAKRLIVGNCWIYQDTTNPKGYAKFDSHRFAHIVSYEIFKGERKSGLHVKHSCNNKKCFNPDHLSEGDIGSNIREAARDGLMSKRSTNKLTYEDAQIIRFKHDLGETQKMLALEYNVKPSHISNIISNKKWKLREK